MSLPAVADVPSRETLEAEALLRHAKPAVLSAEDQARLERVRQIDPYVTRFADGDLEIDGAAMKAVGVDRAWIEQPPVRQALSDLRDEQQRIMAALASEAERRPLDFASSGARFWPRDLDPGHLLRLDRWASDPGFEGDVLPLELAIHDAHQARVREQRLARQAIAPPDARVPLPRPIPDGFGGTRDTPAPDFTDVDPGIRIAAFDAAAKRPTDRLLLLLRLAGEHPRAVAFASDGRLMALDGAPTIMAPLLHGWRHDERVAALVTATVRASREAGRPTWPPEIASAVRAFAMRGKGRRPSQQPDRGRDRDLQP